MTSLLRALVWYSATLVFASATFAGDLIVGPWVILRQDGGVVVGIETVPGTTAELQIGSQAPIAGTSREVRRPHQNPSQVIEFALASGSWRPGPFTVICKGDKRDGVLPQLTEADAPARIAIVGGWNYPEKADLDALAAQLGGPVQVVIALGEQLDLHLGAGGWEAAIPLVVIAPIANAKRSVAGPAGSDWRQGLQWGCLGLPAASSIEGQIRAIARDLSAWQIFLEPDATWDPSLLAPMEERNPRPLLALLNLCQRMRIPLIIGAGHAAGMISEPLLADDKGSLAIAGMVAPGNADDKPHAGARVVLLAGGEGLAELADTVAEPVDEPAVIGISADAKRLTMVVQALSQKSGQVLVYDADGQGNGWGIGDAANLFEHWKEHQDAESLLALSWLDSASLGKAAIGPEDVAKVMASAATDDAAKRLVRRYGSFDAKHVTAATEQWPEWLKRDTALRQLARRQYWTNDPLSDLVTKSSDARILRATLATISGQSDQELIALLVQRLQRQADKELALDADLIMQHSVVATVFDSPYLSPTVLRPLALKLKELLDVSIRGPVDRFLANAGTVRPP